MANDNQLKGFRQTYQETGSPGYGGGNGPTNIDPGTSGSHRDNNWKRGAAQAKMKNADKVGPYSNVKDQFGPKY
jgi:hypothetical protein